MFKRKNPSIDVSPAKLPRNAFDLSERALYTQAPGMLLPVFVKDMNPDEKVVVDIKTQLQAMTLKGRAFSNMQQQFAAYFVPYRVLWSYWQPFISGLSTSNTNKSALMVSSENGTSFNAPNFRPFKVLQDCHFFKDSLGFSFGENFSRLCDLLGYGNVFMLKNPREADGVDLEGLSNYSVNGFRMLAYQKIYQDHFLDDRFEKRNVKAYNVDYVNPSSSTFGELEQFQLRYAKYNRDFLTNIQPSPLFLTNVDTKIKSFVGNSALPLFSSNDVVVDTSSWSSGQSYVSASSIRNLFALDKMAQISSRASKTYRAQMLAHYGVKVDDDDTLSKYCGGFSHDLETSTVVATADGSASDSSTNFGQQGGFIDNVNGGRIEFDSKGDFGVFMILSWISPAPLWDANGIDAFNCKFKKEDYFHPEFMDLGMQPLTAKYLSSISFGSTLGPESPKFNDKEARRLSTLLNISKDEVYGWTERFAEYKSSYDKCYGEFKKTKVDPSLFVSGPIGSLSFLTHHMMSSETSSALIFGSYNSPKKVSLDSISIRPDVLNDVVEVAYKGHQYEDPFRVETTFVCSMIRNMSVSGLPRLNS